MFTRQELRVLAFLVVSFLLGIAVWAYRNRWQPLPEIAEDERLPQSQAVRVSGDEAVGREAHPGKRGIIVLNDATRGQLETIPGIGPVTASSIVEYRDRVGGFRSIDELIQVKGIGKSKLEKIKPYLELN